MLDFPTIFCIAFIGIFCLCFYTIFAIADKYKNCFQFLVANLESCFHFPETESEPMEKNVTVSHPRSRAEYVSKCKSDAAEYLKRYQPLLRYIRDDRQQPIGVLMAFRSQAGNIHVGVSLAHSNKEKFDRHIGIVKSFKKMQPLDAFNFKKVHPRIRKDVEQFLERVRRYYHGV